MAAERRPGGFGSRLREARERRGISLRQIANATKISMSSLEALERNDISRLPGGIFSRAFVRSYAIEVGLDPEETIHDFIAQFPHDSVTAGHPTSEPHEDNEAHESNRATATTFVRLVVISIPIVAAVLYFGNPGGGAPEPTPAASRPAELERPPEPPPGSVIPEGAPAAPVAGNPPPATPQAGPAPAAPPIAAPARGGPPASTGGRVTVGLVATGPCWVSAVVDGQQVVARELQAGDRVSFDVARDVVLTAGDPAALEITLNGAGARPLGGAGRAVTVRMTPANFKQYLASP